MPTAEHPEAPLSPAAVRDGLEGSLRRLQTDYLDVYYLHQPDRATALGDTYEVLAKAVEDGKVRRLGVSNYAAWQVADLECLAQAGGWPRPTVSQVVYNLLARHIEAEYVEFVGSHRIETIVFNPLAGGLLTGKYTHGTGTKGGERFDDPTLGSMYRQRYWGDDKLAAMEALRSIAEQAGMSLGELAYRWLRSRPVVDGILLGASRIEQLQDNLRLCAQPPVSADVAAECDMVWAQIAGTAPAYNR